MLWWFPFAQCLRFREMHNHSKVILCQRREQKLRLNSLPRASWMKGFKPRVSDPRALLLPPHHAAIILPCWDGEGQRRRPSAVWKNQVCTRFEVCPHRVLTARVFFCLALELESRLPIQPGNGPGIQTGRHFCQTGNWFSLKKFSSFFPCPLSQITPPSRPFSRDKSSKWYLLSMASGVPEVSEIYMDEEWETLTAGCG